MKASRCRPAAQSGVSCQARGRPGSSRTEWLSRPRAPKAGLETGGDKVIFTSGGALGTITAPKMMFASASTISWIVCAASLTSSSVRSLPPVTLMRMPLAPSIEASSSGLLIAACAACNARPSPLALADGHHRRACALHDGLDVREVEVDEAGHRDQVGDALDALAEHVVGEPERLDDAQIPSPSVSRRSFGMTMSASTRSRSISTPFSATRARRVAFEGERSRDHPDSERVLVPGDVGHDGRGAGSGATAHAGGEEHHVGARDDRSDVVLAGLGGLLPHGRVAARAKPLVRFWPIDKLVRERRRYRAPARRCSGR